MAQPLAAVLPPLANLYLSQAGNVPANISALTSLTCLVLNVQGSHGIATITSSRFLAPLTALAALRVLGDAENAGERVTLNGAVAITALTALQTLEMDGLCLRSLRFLSVRRPGMHTEGRAPALSLPRTRRCGGACSPRPVLTLASALSLPCRASRASSICRCLCGAPPRR